MSFFSVGFVLRKKFCTETTNTAKHDIQNLTRLFNIISLLPKFYCQQQQQQTAQRLALYLKDALVRIKNHQQNRNERRPNDLLLKSNNNNSITMMDNFEFPTPIEEPKKCIQALYIGFIPVTKPMGVDILNMAIEEIINSLKMSLTNENHDEIELMRPVLVNISPSNIVVECQETGATLVECRVRFVIFF